ncbi:non-ribosomal peptide synthetase [Trichocoleus sp. DQ-A3]|uniref:non-ribosomal peptide synthetase n=1 Tax=Cyanophyceae TaxID=3028117 RepID=UPI0016880108|nr:non-ribosomal peptide synthetase [Coleofasciculus sp. FACHB-125]MBD1902823.1 amino acid adenylation domain-containing protein [Coleofasciculus sp. FACHB-125]
MVDFCQDFPENPSKKIATLADILRYRAVNEPEKLAFTFLQDGETPGENLTYRELDRRSRAIASHLQAMGLSGERALLLYPPGLDYLAAFFGCLYAGAIAVPAYPPRNQRNTPRIQAILQDAQAKIALTTTAIFAKVRSLLAQKTDSDALNWLTTDNIANGIEEYWEPPSIHQDTLAFLQYTSGSTGIPKGVMLSHGNLLHNAAMTYRLMEHSPSSKFVSWLPIYHDMGLIGGVLQPLYGGFPCYLMSPASFLVSPYRWLKAISDYQGTTSGGPNFAYELCVQKITPEQKETLDLSRWSVAFNGAEPIRQDTLERFADAFASCGFLKTAFYPCYGMAEATLIVSGGVKAAVAVTKTVQKTALERNQVIDADDDDNSQPLVGCGNTLPEQEIAIANPETLTQCAPDEIGEIWVSGPSVGHGYWNRPEETAQTFRAYLVDTDEKPFLRTGDLGFLHNGELFITGRAKDLIIIRGRNLYPQDIERTAECCHPGLRAGSGAAFAVEVGNEERLVVVQEVEFRAKPNVEEVTAAIRQAVAEEHEIQVYAVVLIKGGSIPKTSSGKIQRRATRAEYLAGELDVIGSSILENSYPVENEDNLTREELLAVESEERQQRLEAYLQRQVARVLGVASFELDFGNEPQRTQRTQRKNHRGNISIEQPLSSFGLDSLMVFELKNRIEVDLGVAVSIADLFEGVSITQLATQILDQLTQAIPSGSIPLCRVEKTTDEYPLSFSQARLWFVNQLQPGTPAYNIPIAVRLTGRLDVPVLVRSIHEIIRRHEILRTSFALVEGEPVQAISGESCVTLNLPEVDLRQLPDAERQAQAQQFAIAEAQTPFDLAQPPLFRAKLLHLTAEESMLLLTLHHIVADGWSVKVLVRELTALYEAFSTGKPSPLAELPIQYVDYVDWQRRWFSGERLEIHLNYWKQQLGGELPVLELPTDRARSPIQTFRGAQQTLVLPKALTEAIKMLGQQEGVTLFMTLLAAFQTLLYRYSGQEDILVGSPIANRDRAELESLIGCFVNTLVLRTDLAGNPSFKELLVRVRKIAIDAYVHQDLPFEKLVELQSSRDLSYNPIFQVMFVLQNPALSTVSLPELTLKTSEIESGTAKFDLFLSMIDTEQGLSGTLEYNTDLFNADTITRMLGHFQTLLEGIVADPEQCLSDLPLLNASEHHTLLVEWNDTQVDYPQKCIHQLFEQQVEKTPDAIALIFDNVETGFSESLTYRELNNRANQLAHHLQQMGVQPDVLVGICMERSLEMVVALLGILKAGGAYVPLDPTYPKERLAFMLADAQVSLLLTQQYLVNQLPQHQAIICLDTEWETITQEGTENPISSATPENLAYVIYTSGSTGKPKGAMNTHLGLNNRLLWMQDTYKLTTTDRVLQKTPFGFDVSVWEFFLPLLTGASLVLAKPGGHQDSGYLVQLIAKQKITTLHFVPSMLQVFLEELGVVKCNSIKRVFCSGEALPFDLQKRFFIRLGAVELHNLYGPTEAAIDVTFWACQRNSKRRIVPIGRPIANTQIYLLDSHLQPVPIGVPGELHIGGFGLARGYLNRPELTQEKFIQNPFKDLTPQPPSLQGQGEPEVPLSQKEFIPFPSPCRGGLGRGREGLAESRLYKTGDLARYLPDGNIEFLGRIDLQVKIRGFRIELGEIEAVLLQHPQVRETVVLAREDMPNDRRLVAYVVPNPDAVSINELRDRLKQTLPEYMVPSAFVFLDTLPLTPNGKVNRRALPVPENQCLELTVYQPPQSEIEKTIATVWQTLLNLEKVGIHDNFFDIGGHSLLMLQVNHKLRTVFNREISVVTLFQNPTIYSLAQYLSQQQPAFEEMRDREVGRDSVQRARKQIEAINRQKELLSKQGRKIHG